MVSTLVLSAELKNLAVLRGFVGETAQAFHADPESIEDMILAVDEVATNIILHGYEGQPGAIEVRMSLEEDLLTVCLCDQAPLFDPTDVPPPDLSLPLEERRFGGLGIHLAREFMDEVTYCVNPKGCNELTLQKKIRAGDSGDEPNRSAAEN